MQVEYLFGKLIRSASLPLCLLLIVTSSSTAQSKTEDKVILYNSVPVEVELTSDGEIQRFKRERPNHLKGYIVDTKPQVNTAPIEDMAAATGITEQGQAVAVEDMRIRFTSGDSGDMDANSLDVLNSIIGSLRGGLYDQVVLRAKDDPDPISQALNNKRLANCRKYLTAQGIKNEQIITTLSPTVQDGNTITLDYL